MSGRILLTGEAGFTGQHLSRIAAERGYEVIGLQSDLTDVQALTAEVAKTSYDYVVHLAAIAAVTHADQNELYRVNLFGTLNMLSAVRAAGPTPAKMLVASSANVYGNSPLSPLDENVMPAPVNHYAMSKLAMEHMVRANSGELSLLFTRPFNYTGVGQDERFLIPKLVQHFARRAPEIELGNMQVEREFNDVRAVCGIYLDLLETGQPGETYNVCSGQTYSLKQVLEMLGEIAGYTIKARVNPQFVRANEVHTLCGDPARLASCIGPLKFPPLQDTLRWMLEAAPSTRRQ